MDEKTREIINRFIKIHGNKYGYDKVKYVKRSLNVDIYCKKHKCYFKQSPGNHLAGKGCTKCSIESRSSKKSMTQDNFIEKCNKKHKGKYDYSLVKYEGLSKEIIVICPIHGEFVTKAINHLYKSGCRKCGLLRNNDIVDNLEKFVIKAKSIYGDKYDYSKSVYNGTYSPMQIRCVLHDEIFTQIPKYFYKRPACPICSSENRKKYTTSEFVEKAISIHGDKYDYSITKFNGIDKPIEYICPEHGIVNQKASTHVNDKNGCNKCAYVKKELSQEEFIKIAKELHYDKYDYSSTIYTGYNKPVTIICPKHGVFTKIANEHIRKTRGLNGCQICSGSVGEKEVSKVLLKYNIANIPQYTILGYRYKYDFYLPDLNILIEYNGLQHYTPIEYFGGMDGYIQQVARDKHKKEIAKNKNIYLITIKYDVIDIEDYLLHAISKYYKYKVGDKFIVSFLDLCKYLNLSGDTKPLDADKYLTYKK